MTCAFEEFTRSELEPWYHASVVADRTRRAIGRRVIAGEPWSSIGAEGDDPAVRFPRGAALAAERDPVVLRAMHRTFQLLDPPSAYSGNVDIEARVEAVWRDVDGAVAPSSGPDYEAMGRLMAGLA